MESAGYSRSIAVARGDEPADLLFRNGRVWNVFTGTWQETEVAIAGDRIAALGSGYTARTTVDLNGGTLVPGLIDAHVHIESSLTAPPSFARGLLPHGVTTVIADPHEIANVAGMAGIRYLMAASERLPLTFFFMLPSCVPATQLGTAGAELDADALAQLRGAPRVLGLGEFMNVPGAVLGDPDAVAKLTAFRKDHIDGHAPGLCGPWLQAYAAAGPATDHECLTAEEALEKVRAGLCVLVREGTAARNLNALLPAVTAETERRFAFCTDDRHPADLIDEGSIDHCVRAAIRRGMAPGMALRLATLNAAEIFGLRDRGAIAPGRRADLVVVDSLESFQVLHVFAGGRRVAENGRTVGTWPDPRPDDRAVRNTVRVDPDAVSFRIPAQGTRLRVIGIVPDQIVTETRILDARIENGEAVADAERDLAKLAILERHGRGGHVGLGFVQGLGLRRGAIAGSVGHDCHNITAAGTNDADLRLAIRSVVASGGGLAVACDGTCPAHVPLPIAGLMSDKSVTEVRTQMDRLLAAAHALGSPLHDPFMPLSFLALEVIPSLKLTDRGLVDVDRFSFTSLWAEAGK